MPRNISEDSGSWIFPGSIPFFSRRNISDGFGSGFCLEQCQEIFLRILVVGFFLGQYQILFLGEIFLRILVVDFFSFF